MVAISRIKHGKAGVKNGSLPEMERSAAGELIEYMLDLFTNVLREENFPQEWKDTLLVPIPKGGDLTQCDNWQGISLLGCVGKVFTTVIQKWLQKIAEDVLSDSQCKYRALC